MTPKTGLRGLGWRQNVHCTGSAPRTGAFTAAVRVRLSFLRVFLLAVARGPVAALLPEFSRPHPLHRYVGAA